MNPLTNTLSHAGQPHLLHWSANSSLVTVHSTTHKEFTKKSFIRLA